MIGQQRISEPWESAAKSANLHIKSPRGTADSLLMRNRLVETGASPARSVSLTHPKSIPVVQLAGSRAADTSRLAFSELLTTQEPTVPFAVDISHGSGTALREFSERRCSPIGALDGADFGMGDVA